MKKKIILSTIFLAGFLVQASENESCNPSNTVLAWDLRDVLVERARESKKQIALKVWQKADNKWELLKSFIGVLFEARSLGHRPDFCMDEILEKIVEKNPALAPYKDMIFEMMTKHVTKDDVVEVLKEAKEAGYQNIIASNIGQESYERMKASMPEFFANFEDAMIAHSQEDKSAKWVAKPQKAYFEELREKVAQEKQIIFIDDKQINVDAAHDLEKKMYGIKYNNAAQLREELVGSGVLQKK